VQWIQHPDGYWLLRNPESVTFVQVSDRDKTIIEQLGHRPLAVLTQEYDITPKELRQLLQMLAATGMLEGTQPQKPPKRKFSPLQLLFFKVPLFNPDRWLTRHIHHLRWIWTRPFFLLLSFFLAGSVVIGLSQSAEILFTGQQLVASQGVALLLPFALLAMLVVTLHELAHAFTLKHYGGIVPEMGLMFMLLIPAAYTNTTDSYCLVKRSQRVLVVAAGVLCQLIIGAIALSLWNLSASGTWLHTGSYLLLVAALFTVVLNLNPLNKFDGYYLAVALSGINNLRSRSFGFYSRLLQGRSLSETPHDYWILATYAPFSLAYILLVFGGLLGLVGYWTLSNLPFWALILLTLWAIYYFFYPDSSASTPMTSPNLNSRSSLQVVPPATRSVSSPKSPVQESTYQPSITATKSPRRWVVLGVATIGLVLIGFIPTPYEVGGPVELDAREGAREFIRTPVPGIVTKIFVEPGARVNKGDTVAQLSSLELDTEIAEISKELAEARQNLEAARKQQTRAQANLTQTIAQKQVVAQKADRLRDRTAMLAQGTLTPEIQELEVERLQLAGRLEEANVDVEKYQRLYTAGAVAEERLKEVKIERDNFQSQLDAKIAAIAAAKQSLQDSATDMQAEASSQDTALQAARMIRLAEDQMAAQQDAVTNLEARVKQLETLRQNLTLKASLTGTVLTSDLDVKKMQELKPGEEFLLQIADLSKLTATVRVREEDLEFFNVGDTVTFRPRQDKLRTYNAQVNAILPKLNPDESQQKHEAWVRIVVDNSDGKLRPSSTGYAKIWSEWIPLYERLGRELLRLWPERFL
jgi:putative peptide zinc metalloprotease protein